MFKNKVLLKVFVSTSLTLLLISPLLVGAQVQNPTSGVPNSGGGGPLEIEIKNPFKCNEKAGECSIPGLLRSIINNILIPIGAVVAVLMIMYAGFLYVTAGGNSTQIAKAHQALLYAIIGAAILLGAWVLSEAIKVTIDQLRK